MGKDEEKKQRLLGALDKGMVMIHLDARRAGVFVPKALCAEAHLRLNLSYRFDPPDLAVSEWGVRCTLSFSGSRFTVAVPWSALFAITSHVTREFWLYPDDMPAELIAQATEQAHVEVPPPEAAEGRRPALRPVECPPDVEATTDDPPAPEASAEPGPDDPPKPKGRGHLRIVK